MSQLEPLAVGRKVTVWPFQSHGELPAKGLVTTIEKTFPDKICLGFLESGPRHLLEKGGRVRIKSWTGEALYFWDAKILEVSGSAKRQMTISILDDGVKLQRRERSA
jgi:hypothetical protein